MSRQQNTPGAIVEINIKDEYYVYAQILHHASFAFFDYKSPTPLKDFSVLKNAPVLFILAIYVYVVSRGHWPKVGKMEIRDDLRVLPMTYIYDSNRCRYEFYDPNTGKVTPVTKDQVAGLEVAAVWGAHHVEDRIEAHYNGVPDKWSESMKWDEVKFPPKE